jgi:5-(carboxyamino)imidazole ribonucleotide mutase
MINNKPSVGIIMGSDSDLSTMKGAAEILEQFDISYEMTVISAHRTPKKLFEYVNEMESKGIEVVIAGAGGAAHLPGVIAALCPLPVIGIPIKTPSLNGLDSLLSIVQMPTGVPVATVAIDNSKNASLLAAQILGIKYPKIREQVKTYKKEMERKVEAKAEKMITLGYKAYLNT